MVFNCRHVPVHQINFDDATFNVSEEDAPDTRIGDPGILRLIRPPILLPSNDTYIIISGFWQLSADSLKDSRKIRCHVLDVGTSPLECARIAVSSHALTHSVNIITSARAITLLSNYVEDHTGLVDVANQCGLSVNFSMVQKLLKVDQMPAPVKSGLLEGTIALPVALLLDADGNTEKICILASVFRELGMSLNRQREFLEWVNGICRRDKLTTRQLFNEKDVVRIRNDQESDRRQKYRLIRQYLKKRRFPSISEFERKHDNLLKTLNLQKGTQLIPPAHFEGETYCLKIEFDSYAALVHKQGELNKIVESPDIQKLWQLM